MPEVQKGDYWIVGFSTEDGGMSYTVMEIVEGVFGRFAGLVCGSEVDCSLNDVDEWVRKVEMPC